MIDNTQAVMDTLLSKIEKGNLLLVDSEIRDFINEFLQKRGYSDEDKKRWWRAFYTYWLSKTASALEKDTAVDEKERLLDAYNRWTDDQVVAFFNESGEKERVREVMKEQFILSIQHFFEKMGKTG